jgi:phage I-like protein
MFAFGETATTKGTFYLSQGSAGRAVVAAQEYGNDLVIDLDHKSLWGDSKAVGWFGLSLDEVGLWADMPQFFMPLEGQAAPDGILWLAEGKRLIESYEYRYISPVFWTEYDDQGREVITEVLNFALTNIPATKNRAPLINSRGQETTTMPETTPQQSNISVTTQQELLSQVYALTGETEPEKVKGALAALSQIKSQLVSANAALDAEKTSHKVTATKLREVNLDNLIKEGKLPPAMRQECLSLSEDALTTTLKFLAGLPTPAAQTQQQPPTENTATPEGQVAQLSKAEQEHCKQYGLDPVVYASTKNTYYKNKSVEL